MRAEVSMDTYFNNHRDSANVSLVTHSVMWTNLSAIQVLGS